MRRSPHVQAALVLSVIFGVVIGLPACASFLDRPPAAASSPAVRPGTVGTIAVLGRRVLVAGDAAVTGTDRLLTHDAIPRDVGLGVLEVLDRFSEEAVRFGVLLQAVEAADDLFTQADGLTKARASLRAMQVLIDGAVIPIADPKIRGIVSGVLEGLMATLRDVNVQLLELFRVSEVNRGCGAAAQADPRRIGALQVCA